MKDYIKKYWYVGLISIVFIAGIIAVIVNSQTGVVSGKKADGKDDLVAVGGGFIEVRPDKISILSSAAELATSIDAARAQEAKARAEQRLQSKQDDIDFKRAELALQRAINRIKVQEGNI